jgi:hypothetical protein
VVHPFPPNTRGEARTITREAEGMSTGGGGSPLERSSP